MCGIVGYIGDGDAVQIVVDGLHRLEYRGYDSSGVAAIGAEGIGIRRGAGKLTNLDRLLRESPLDGHAAIGHTRWATHGKPNDTNAHPHRDCSGDIVVIHNGIVENFLTLRDSLRQKGHVFRSDVDTEVIPHLIEDFVNQGQPLESAIRQALPMLEGAHAIVVLSRHDPEKIYAARLGNAGGVVVGLGIGETFIASDIPAILPYTRRMVFLNNGEMAVVGAAGASYSDLPGIPVEKEVFNVPWDQVAAAKGGYKHFMQKEIFEQPDSVTNAIRGRLELDPPGVYLESLRISDEELRSVSKLFIVACGTAWHAGLVGKFMIEELARVPVEVDYASEFRYRQPLIDASTLVVAVTQSGETVDTLVSMEEAKRDGAKLLGIVNAIGSQAARVADGVIYTHAGPEIGVASTKAFTSQIVALYLLALHLGRVKGTLVPERTQQLLQDVLELPKKVGEVLGSGYDYEHLASLYSKCSDFLYLGRGINYPIALEGALKLKEISYIHAEGYPAGEMKHGPIALVDEELPVVAIATDNKLYEKVLSNIEQVKARDGVVIAIATEGNDSIAEKADHVIHVPCSSEFLSPVLSVVPLQLLAYHMAVRRGCDVDQPRNLAKSVTVE